VTRPVLVCGRLDDEALVVSARTDAVAVADVVALLALAGGLRSNFFM